MENKLVTLKEVRENPVIMAFLDRAAKNIKAMGYTEHGLRHAKLVSDIADNVMKRLGFSERDAQLAAIAGYIHDIGNSINREHHGTLSASLAAPALLDMGMDPQEVAVIISALGNHEEEIGHVVNHISAALILADKTDVHRTRVQVKRNDSDFDVHDRVCYSVTSSFLDVDAEHKRITLNLVIDSEVTSVMEYFELFMTRMTMSRKAAAFLGCEFSIVANGARFL
ncbi:MAG TPA: HD domain-containing protein [Bacillota bacterium]|nr:HD domain-containing protein [Bacillota bacterium]HOH10684.1 HD domain-containing protein [Bacillota bacterium]HOY88886.1 HD domain-containing protein [Bacillota bacterium]HPI01312.1 HD domain-containing protein [Bacillota bacterium]HPM63711.1 HD domain-containing protein [Bacillota bacterium]